MFVGQPFHDFINATHYNVFCLFSEKNHTILIFMTYSIFFNSRSTNLNITKYVF